MTPNSEFLGYLRHDGRKGIRNTILVVYLVECAHHVAREIVHPFRRQGVHLIGCRSNRSAPPACPCKPHSGRPDLPDPTLAATPDFKFFAKGRRLECYKCRAACFVRFRLIRLDNEDAIA